MSKYVLIFTLLTIAAIAFRLCIQWLAKEWLNDAWADAEKAVKELKGNANDE